MVIQDTLSPEWHINQLFGSTYRILANSRVAFHYIDMDMMKTILTSMIRPRLEYAAVVWLPNLREDTRKFGRIERVAIKVTPELTEHMKSD